MNTVAWIVQAVLAAIFLGAGLAKATQPKQRLLSMSSNMAWTEDFTDRQVTLIGVVEVLGAIGLVLPWALDIAPVLTPIAAVGLAITMAGAAVTHARRKEYAAVTPTVVLLAASVFVAVVRFGDLA